MTATYSWTGTVEFRKNPSLEVKALVANTNDFALIECPVLFPGTHVGDKRGPHHRIGSRRYGALPATTPMLATVSPLFIEGTAQTYRTTPLDGARASHTVLPNRSVT